MSQDPPPTVRPEIATYYEQGNEYSRLTTGHGRLEFIRTQEILRRLLPKPPAVVLDIGGGTGVHAAWLANDGYQVTVIDPIPLHTRAAAALPGVQSCCADARALPIAPNTADAVLLLGPLYHLPEPSDRVRALSEARRAARANARLAVATINRFAALHDTLKRSLYLDDDLRPVVDTATTHGHLEPGHLMFTTAYFHHPDEVLTELRAAGWHPGGQYGLEGAAWLMPHTHAWLDNDHDREALLAALRRTESHPSVLGVSGHLLTTATAAPALPNTSRDA